jgi:photosystem II stability/assembly factor-like uncharacterized protein
MKMSINRRLFLLIILAAFVAGCSSTNHAKDSEGVINTIFPVSTPSPELSLIPTPTASVQASTPTTAPTSTSIPSPLESLPSKLPLQGKMGQATALRLADAQTGWVGGRGWIAKSKNAGKQWTMQYIGSGTIQQIFALNDQLAWATTLEDSNLLMTADGGVHWSNIGKAPNHGFLHFVTKTEGFSANTHTLDGGKSWSALTVPNQIVGDAYFHDKVNGWAVTQTKNTVKVERTIDGGKSWSSVMTRTVVSPITGALIRSAGKDNAWVEWIGDSGMTQTSYSVFQTSDGGKTWRTVIANSTAGGGPAPGFAMDYNKGPSNQGAKPGPLYVVDPTVAFMGGQCLACDSPNTVGWTTDGGKTWKNGQQSFEGFDAELLAMADSEQGWLIVTDSVKPSVMYTTEDGAKHWKKVYTFAKP